MSDIDYVECGSCFGRAYGFTRTELAEEGWELKSVRGRSPFNLCPECAHRFAESRRLNRLLKLEPARS